MPRVFYDRFSTRSYEIRTFECSRFEAQERNKINLLREREREQHLFAKS